MGVIFQLRFQRRHSNDSTRAHLAIIAVGGIGVDAVCIVVCSAAYRATEPTRRRCEPRVAPSSRSLRVRLLVWWVVLVAD